ncbi:MAG: aldo/keto reductase [Stackebrandtia sp.]
MKTHTLAGSGLQVSAMCLGAMTLGGVQDKQTSFAILDRFVEAGGTFVDTANAYMFWLDGGTGDESENLLGAWMAERGNRDDLVLATKVGRRPTVFGGGLPYSEPLTAPRIAAQLDASLARLGTDRVDVYWTHRDDRDTPQEETVGALAEAVTAGKALALGASNHTPWRVERARALADAAGGARYTLMQNRYSYLQPRPDAPLASQGHVHATSDTVDYAGGTDDMALLTYSALLNGSYVRPDKPLEDVYDHPGTASRLKALDEVASQTGATRNQVVLAWLTGLGGPTIPLVAVSSIRQLDEAISGMDLVLDADQHRRLTEAA